MAWPAAVVRTLHLDERSLHIIDSKKPGLTTNSLRSQSRSCDKTSIGSTKWGGGRISDGCRFFSSRDHYTIITPGGFCYLHTIWTISTTVRSLQWNGHNWTISTQKVPNEALSNGLHIYKRQLSKVFCWGRTLPSKLVLYIQSGPRIYGRFFSPNKVNIIGPTKNQMEFLEYLEWISINIESIYISKFWYDKLLLCKKYVWKKLNFKDL